MPSVEGITHNGVCYCPDCGSTLDNMTERLVQMEEQIEELERERRVQRSKIRRLRHEQDEARREDPRFPAAMDVLEHWKATVHPNARELGGERLEKAMARLAAYSVEELKRSCDGYALKPYVVNGKRTHEGPKDSWQADASLIFRDAKHVDAGLRIAERADDLRAAFDPDSPADATDGASLGPLGTAALRLARYGFMVFPCRQGAKAPATRNGLLDAKRDPAVITRAWTSNPLLNIGVRAGEASGIVVLDVDEGKGGWDEFHRLQNEHGDFPQTPSVTTPSGGEHFYFLHPGVEIRNTVDFPAPGLDIRGDGGYVLAPPSIVNGRRYEQDEAGRPAPMPPWLVETLRSRQKREDTTLRNGRDWAAFVAEGATQGQRDQRMTQLVGHLFSHLDNPTEVLEFARLANLRVSPPLKEKDLNRIVGSIAKARTR